VWAAGLPRPGLFAPPASKEEAAAFPHADILVFSFFIFFILSAGFCCVPEVCPS